MSERAEVIESLLRKVLALAVVNEHNMRGVPYLDFDWSGTPITEEELALVREWGVPDE